jgi:hypothetical protein
MVELYLHSSIWCHGIVLNYIIKYRDYFRFTGQHTTLHIARYVLKHIMTICQRVGLEDDYKNKIGYPSAQTYGRLIGAQ